ncbi:MAG: DUF488 family protein [Alphaproteobacteria bacterium]|nr:DUF488 family protein [Alphaproteobacteria bacterium]
MAEKKSLFARQKLLLALLQIFGGRLYNTDLQKYLFLFTMICEKEKSYEFVPYKFGCFSFQSYADRRRLIEIGAIFNEDNWQLADTNIDYLNLISEDCKRKMISFKDKYKELKADNLIKEVYRKYPYYAIKSTIVDKLMSGEELAEIESLKPKETKTAFFTIGYEGKSFENYLNRLIKNNVKILCDVRKNPISRKYGFSGSVLKETLKKLDIDYIHIPELGIVSEKRQTLTNETDYQKLFNEYEKTTLQENHEAMDKLYGIFKEYRRIAITCFEADHRMCHRSRVSKAMEQRLDKKFSAIHI